MAFAFLVIAIQTHLSTTTAHSMEGLMSAIRNVESNGKANAVGDNGRAIGPYQIHFGYWKDSGVTGRWQQCHNRAYAERVMRAYWRRYCPSALASGHWKTLARVHNGGPRGHLRASTHKYWIKVRAALTRVQPSGRAKRFKPGVTTKVVLAVARTKRGQVPTRERIR